jgi:MFS family permease
VPLGDKLDRRRLILVPLTLNMFCLAMPALAPTFAMLSLASLAIGITAVTAQIIIPAVPAERGRVAGTLLSGLSAGLLLARALSGFGGGKHAADDRFRLQRLRFQDALAPEHCLRISRGRGCLSSLTLAEKRAILASTPAPRSYADLYYCGPGGRRADRNSVRDVGCPRASFAFVLAPTRTCFTVASGTAIGLSPRTGRQPLLAEP